jgi:hypothetical protein
MALKIKHKRVDLNFIKKNYPILFETLEEIEKQLKEKNGNVTMAKELVGGLCIEIALKSDGTVGMFEDDLPSDLLGEEEDF